MQKEFLKWYNWFQTFWKRKYDPFMHYMFIRSIWWKKIIWKFQSFKILKQKATREMIILLNCLVFVLFTRFKFSNFRCRSHVQEITMQKNMFSWYFGIFCVYACKRKYLCTIMYTCEKSPSSHELSYVGLFKFSYLSLFHVNLFVKSSFKKV
jgi:hypothetical protein